MRIVVVGNGKIGKAIISLLASEGHDLVVVDESEERVAEAQNMQDILVVHGNGAVRSVLVEAGVSHADLLIAVTAVDEINLLCCLIAKKLGAKSTIARVRNPEYSDELSLIREDLGLSMALNPEFNAAADIFSVLRFPGLMNVEKFAKGRVEIAEFRLPKNSPLGGLSLIEISGKYKIHYLICAVRRGERTFIPKGDFTLMPEDRISFLATPSESERFLGAAGISARPPKKVIIVGAGRVSFYLARLLKSIGVHPTVIDNDINKCWSFSAAFPDCVVLHGDGSDRELLVEEGLDSADAFVSLTGHDEVNILLSMYATSRKVPKVVTKVSRVSMTELVGEEKLGSVVSPKAVTADQVISYVRALQNSEGSSVETLYHLVDDTVEALEFFVREKDDELIEIPIKNLKLKSDLLIGCIIRGEKVLVPGGDDCIQLGDRVVVVTTNRRLSDLHDILD